MKHTLYAMRHGIVSDKKKNKGPLSERFNRAILNGFHVGMTYVCLFRKLPIVGNGVHIGLVISSVEDFLHDVTP